MIARIQQQGECWCGLTHWRGRSAMRISVSCWATTDADVECSLVSILACADEAAARPVEAVSAAAG